MTPDRDARNTLLLYEAARGFLDVGTPPEAVRYGLLSLIGCAGARSAVFLEITDGRSLTARMARGPVCLADRPVFVARRILDSLLAHGGPRTIEEIERADYRLGRFARSMEAELFVPLTIGGRALGAVLLGKRILGESYGASEYELIGGIADLAARTLRGRQADPKALRANAVTETRASRRLAALRSRHPALARFAGQGQATLDLFEEIVALADLDLPVLIQGETGTGKELVARALHELSRRSAEPFEAVNCAAIPRELVANVLFGHERGAFTGALSRARGAFEQAGQGTIFLDEIGDMSLDAQASLLRVLQERSFRRVGGEGELPAPARVVSASNIDLAEAVRAGTFRSDLFYRIQMFMIRVRPLRERPEDVPGIVERILAARLDAQNASLTPSREFLAALSARELPGNYRELESLVLGAARRARGEHVLRAQHLLESPAPSRNESLRSSQDGSARSTSKKRIDPDLPTYADMERRYICEIVRLAKGNRNRAAKLMGIPRTTLASRMKKLGITESE